ncbi:hypothetical protein CO015_03015 [candidate division WWE3 bacterium CG_4_8_14_3_um_filter_42_11]|uniref:Uncharacterized protein n=1 Tax=candidate division WWE3 bacterium CG_4_8_14_3_um_filter_42_11 TaxID=1975076 RepID=A0A2M8G6N9_UNCKA|nr:MAG: hypothetical protein AUJ38_02235 [bacterium CG1_02_42_9]PJC68718.1 MAG: hypothetical protein CO015_03015 [candidate division WWE3 bacterium CG_4_8_14_3_um_filter_42_11]
MLSKILLKLIDEAVLPAVILVSTKIIGLGLINFFFHFTFEIKFFPQMILPALVYTDSQEALLANSYSNLLMYGAIFVGFLWVIVKSIHLHETHISPKATQKLARWNLLKLLTNSYNLYHQAVVWFLFLWIAVGILIFYSFSDLTYWWVSVASLAFNFVLTYLIIDDVEREFYARRAFNNGYS